MGIFLRNYGLVYHSFKYFNKAIEINPLDPWDYCARGLAYSMVGEFEKSLHDYQSALERVYLYCILNNKNVAISLLIELQQRQKYDSQHSRSLYLELKHMLWYDDLRSDRRFQQILAKQEELYEENLQKYVEHE
jgi:tetratricopeptide (TPR) repeat protein